MKRFCLLCLSAIILLASCHSPHKSGSLSIDPYHYSGQKKVVSQNGAVVSAHPLASKVGVEILKKGGNAVDAAIATQLALAVVYPNAGNIGGGGFLVARLENGKQLAIDYREMAPGAAHRDMYIDKDGNANTDKSQDGHLAAGVPGTVAGLFASHQYARLSFAELIQPAIDLAEKGYTITAAEANHLNSLRDEWIRYNTITPVFVKEGGWKAGDTLVQTDLANTLKRIRDHGQKGFYEGKTAQLIVEEMKRGGGIITEADLKNYTAKERTPHVFSYKNYTIIGMPMPSSGGTLIHQMMKMIEDRNISQYKPQSPEATQLLIEVMRRAYADRAEYMGDADHYAVPEKQLTSDTYLKARMNDYQAGVAGNSKTTQPGQPRKESEETTHLSVIDKNGNAVAVTTTLNNSYGSRTVVAGAGFILNDEMDDFSVKPGVPNMYGAVGGEANAIKAGKRMLSSMTPTVVLKENKPYLVVGTPGGTTIPTNVFQVLVNILEFNLGTEEAVYAGKIHHQWLPDAVMAEKSFPEATVKALQKMGYTVTERGGIGRMEVIKVLPDGRFEAVADKRGEDSAEGF